MKNLLSDRERKCSTVLSENGTKFSDDVMQYSKIEWTEFTIE